MNKQLIYNLIRAKSVSHLACVIALMMTLHVSQHQRIVDACFNTLILLLDWLPEDRTSVTVKTLTERHYLFVIDTNRFESKIFHSALATGLPTNRHASLMSTRHAMFNI